MKDYFKNLVLKFISLVSLFAAGYFWLQIEETVRPAHYEEGQFCFYASDCSAGTQTNWYYFALSMLFLAITLGIWIYLFRKTWKEEKANKSKAK